MCCRTACDRNLNNIVYCQAVSDTVLCKSSKLTTSVLWWFEVILVSFIVFQLRQHLQQLTQY